MIVSPMYGLNPAKSHDSTTPRKSAFMELWASPCISHIMKCCAVGLLCAHEEWKNMLTPGGRRELERGCTGAEVFPRRSNIPNWYT